MKKLSKDKLVNAYYSLQKKRKKIKTRSILLAAFVFGVNIFAWFVFVSKANVSVNANIISWDVDFSDSSEVISNVIVETTDLYPGMPTYTKEIYVTNSSDIGATFDYEVSSIQVLGEEVMTSSTTQEGAVTYLNQTFPFLVSFNSSKVDLAENDNMVFTINIDWPLEADDTGAREYYRLTSHYKFDPTVTYYNLTNLTYNKVDNVTEDLFEVNKTGYYLEKDDADSFWGSNCQEYRNTSGEACFSFKILLKVTQKAQ